MKKHLIILFILFQFNTNAQNNEWHHYLGSNIIQIPTLTADFSYLTSNRHWYDLVVNTGYTFHYLPYADINAILLSPHYKGGNDGYHMLNQSGPYVNPGIKFNFRKDETDNKYFFIGFLSKNSFLHEKTRYSAPSSNETHIFEHNKFIYGLSIWAGFNFKMKDKINSDLGIQISKPLTNISNLYGYQNYIPGIGYMEIAEPSYHIFPLIVWNFKYKIGKN